jgi:hypothetical protein
MGVSVADSQPNCLRRYCDVTLSQAMASVESVAGLDERRAASAWVLTTSAIATDKQRASTFRVIIEFFSFDAGACACTYADLSVLFRTQSSQWKRSGYNSFAYL